MSDGVRCYFLEPTLTARRSLRRFTFSSDKTIPPCGAWGHDAKIAIDTIPIGRGADGVWNYQGRDQVEPFLTDPRWPATCAKCGFTFDGVGEFQIFVEPFYERTDTGEVMTLRDATPGAIWHADWLSDYDEYRGPDGRTLVCRCPDGHDWTIDGRASNCDSPCASCGAPYHLHYGQTPRAIPCERFSEGRPHKCWVRHGEAPDLTVDKNGVTCNAGAGSILTPKWHGFLRAGVLVVASIVLVLLASSSSSAADRPDLSKTPGVARDLSRAALCSTKWGLDDRHVSEGMKAAVAAAYGLPPERTTRDKRGRVHHAWPSVEFDHSIPREAGGADDVRNLYPQEWVYAHQKDRLENKIHRMICAGEIEITAAQHAIATDWRGLYQQIFGEPVSSVARSSRKRKAARS
jgi:hypothetical protein